jgi:hypothetical protein
VERGLNALKSLFEGSVKVGRLSREQAEQQFRQARGTLDYAELKDVDMASTWLFSCISVQLSMSMFCSIVAFVAYSPCSVIVGSYFSRALTAYEYKTCL